VAISRSNSSLYSTDKDTDAVSQQRAAIRPILHHSGSQGHLGFEEISQGPLYLSLENITNIRGKVKVFDNCMKPVLMT
jgi:hypothetical protein